MGINGVPVNSGFARLPVAAGLAAILSLSGISCIDSSLGNSGGGGLVAPGRVSKDEVWGEGTLIPSSFPNKTPPQPTWLQKVDCFYQIRIDKFAEPKDGESFLAAATRKLDYLTELGANCVLVNPVTKFDGKGVKPEFINFYGVYDHEILDPYLGSPEEFSAFVRRAQSLGIRVVLDVVPHGVTFRSPMLSEHPDWFKKDKGGKATGTWGMADFDWKNPEVREWWISTMCDKWILKYGLDGVRCDCEPNVSGYGVLWDEVMRRCEAAGHPVMVMSEGPSPERKMSYHISQMDYKGYSFQETLNVVDEIKRLNESYYTVELSSHDYKKFFSDGKPWVFGYGALLSPFIPLWRMGDEFASLSVYATGRSPDDIASYGVWRLCDHSGSEALKGKLRKMPAGGYLGQDFLLEGSKEVSAHLMSSSDGNSGKVRMSLYRSASSYKLEDTLRGRPIAQKTFSGFGKDAWLTLNLDKLVYGHVLLVLDEADGDVSVFGAENSNYGGSFFSPSPSFGDSSFDMDVKAQAPGSGRYGEVLYFAPLDWASLSRPANALLQERVARMIAARKAYDYILSPFVARMKDRNVVKVDAEGAGLQSYAIYRGRQAIVVAGNDGGSPASLSLNVPLKEMRLAGYPRYKATRLLEKGGEAKWLDEQGASRLQASIGPGDVEAFLIEGVDAWTPLYGKAPDAFALAETACPLSQCFSPSSPFSKLRVKAYRDSSAGGLRISISEAASSEARRLFSSEFKSFSNSDWLELEFPSLPSGRYKWIAEPICDGGSVGVWRTDGENAKPLSSRIGEKPLESGNFIAEWR